METRLGKIKDRHAEEREITTGLNIINSHIAQGLGEAHLYTHTPFISALVLALVLCSGCPLQMGQESGARPRISAIKNPFCRCNFAFPRANSYLPLQHSVGSELSPASLAPVSPAAAQGSPARLQQLRAEFQSAAEPPALKVKAMVMNC